eukprot:SAG31_NODE_8622_length_1418_cov_2.317665_2_plen_70_part_01
MRCTDGSTTTLIAAAPGELWCFMKNPEQRAHFNADGLLMVPDSSPQDPPRFEEGSVSGDGSEGDGADVEN